MPLDPLFNQSNSFQKPQPPPQQSNNNIYNPTFKDPQDQMNIQPPAEMFFDSKMDFNQEWLDQQPIIEENKEKEPALPNKVDEPAERMMSIEKVRESERSDDDRSSRRRNYDDNREHRSSRHKWDRKAHYNSHKSRTNYYPHKKTVVEEEAVQILLPKKDPPSQIVKEQSKPNIEEKTPEIDDTDEKLNSIKNKKYKGTDAKGWLISKFFSRTQAENEQGEISDVQQKSHLDLGKKSQDSDINKNGRKDLDEQASQASEKKNSDREIDNINLKDQKKDSDLMQVEEIGLKESRECGEILITLEEGENETKNNDRSSLNDKNGAKDSSQMIEEETLGNYSIL